MRSLCATILVAGSLFVSGAAYSADSDPAAYPRKIYAEVNNSLKSLQSVRKQVEIEGAPVDVSVTGWFDGAVLRKMEARYPDDHGELIEEYYYDANGLVFVYQVVVTAAIDGSSATRREHRYYFSNGRMVRWLDENKQAVSVASQDFADKAAELLDSSQTLSSKLKPKNTNSSGAANLKSTVGVFAGVEQGDYLHLMLKVNGEEQSFFVLQPDAKLERLIDDPKKFMGKRVRILWKRTIEDMPEAGGKQEIDAAVSVELAQ